MAANNRVNIGIGFTVDKSGLQEMQSLFQQIANKAQEPGNKANESLQKAGQTAAALDKILEKTFNTELGTLNVTKFNQELNKSGLSLKTVQSDLAGVGNQGATAYNKLAQAVLGTNIQLKQTSHLLDQMATTFKNTVRYGIASSVFNRMTGEIQKAYSYSRDLDESLNNIRIVTDKSADNMDKFAVSANKAAKNLGASTLDYTNAALIYYQQGLSDQESQARAETTIKAANVTGQTGQEVSEQLTAVWNGYKVTAEETELYVDKLAAVAATTAADLEELSSGMSKVASAANAMGVDFDDLNAQIATIVSVTRQAPESVGTALKTIYARLGDLKVDGVDEFGVSLGEVSSQLQVMGINILDQEGNMRDMTSVMTEVAEKWNTWTDAQRQAAAVAMAGKRQYNNLIALFENWDMYSDALETSANAMGTLQHQQDIYMESTEARLKRLKATTQDLYDGLIDNDELNVGIDALTNLVQVFDNFIDSFGGGLKSITAFGTIIANIFNKQIIESINGAIQRQQVFQQNLELAQANAQVRAQGAAKAGVDINSQAVEANTKIQIEYAEKIYKARVGLNQEQANTLINYQKEIGNLEEQKVLYEGQLKELEKQNTTLNLNKDTIHGMIPDIEAEVDFAYTRYKAALDNYNLNKKDKAIAEEDLKLSQDQLEQAEKEYIEEKKKLAVAKEYAEISNKNYDAKVKQQNYKQEADDLLKIGTNATTVAQQVTTITTALSSMAMAWSSVSSLLDTWNNKDISFGDKIAQSLMTVTFVLPNLISGFTKLSEVYRNVAATGAGLNPVMAVSNAIKQKSILLLQKETLGQVTLTKAQQAGLAVIVHKIEKEMEEAGAVTIETAAEKLQNLAKEKGIILTDKQAKGMAAAIALKSGDITVTNLLTAAQWALNEAMAANPVLFVITVIASLIAVIAAVTKAIDKWHEKQIEKAKANLEEIKTTQSQIKANEELYDSYIKLNEEYKETGENEKELYDKSLELIDAYGLESARILALAGDYDALSQAIEKAKSSELSEMEDTSLEGAKNAASAAAHNSSKGLSRGRVLGNVYQWDDFNPSDENVKEIFKDYQDGFGSTFAAINLDDPQAMMNWIDALDEAIDYYEKLGNTSDSFYKKIKKERDELSEYATDLRDQLDQLYTAQVEQHFLGFDMEKADATSLYEEIEKIKESLSESGLDESEIDKYINTYLNGVDEVKNARVNLAKEVAEQTETELAVALKTLDYFNESQMAYLQIHLDTGLLDEDLTTWVKENSPILGFVAAQNSASNFEGLISGYSYNKKKDDINSTNFSQAQSDSIYEDRTMSSFMSVEQDAFNTMDAGQQVNELTKAWIENTKYVEENKETILSSLKEEQDQLKETTEAKATEADKDIQSLNESIEKTEDYKNRVSEVQEAVKLYAEDEEALTGAQKGLLEGFKEQSGLKDDEIKQYGESIKVSEEYYKAMGYLDQQITSITENSHNYIEALEGLSEAMEINNALMDDIQSAYSSLSSIVADYNSSQAWTVDNVQKLLEMDDKYVATLQFENGQLSINEESFQAMTIAKLNDLEATVDNEYYTKMLAIAEKDEALSAAAAAAASIAAGSDMLTMGQNAISAAEGVQILKDTLDQIGDPDSDYSKLAEQTEKAWEARKKAIADARSQVGKGGASMRKAMGASSGGSSSSKQNDKELKFLEDEFDRYWELNKIIDKTDRALQRLEKDKENLYRNELIDALSDENELLEQQVQHYKDLAAMQRQEASELQGKLMNNGVQFDAQGNIANYAAATQGMLNWYNQGVTAHNAGSIDDDTFSKVYEKGFEEFKKNLERYDTLFYKELQDTEDKITEMMRKVLANNLKKWELDIELKLNLKELDREWNQFLKDISTDFRKVYKDIQADIGLAAKNAATYLGDSGTLATDLASVSDLVTEFENLKNGLGSDKFESISQVQDKMREVNEQLMDDAKGLYEEYENAWDAYLDGIDQAGSKFDDVQKQFDKVSEELEFQGDLIKLIYGEEAYDLMSKLYEGQIRNSSAQIAALKEESDMWEKLFRDSGATMENQANWTEDQKKYYEEWQDAQSALNDKVREHIELLQNDYLNTINDILKTLETNITGSSLDDVSTEWERISDHSSNYLDNIEKAYEIQKLANTFNEGIASTTSLKNQQKLAQLRDREIALLREKEELTQFDLDAAEARYQIALKEIALEEAQSNKTSMKLTRNAQGNWSYQYVADEEDVMSKRQELLDAYNNLYQLASSAYENNLKSLQELNQKYLDSLRKIYEDTTLTEEERVKKANELNEWYYREYELLAENNEIYRRTLTEAGSAIILETYRQDESAYEAMTDAEREMLEEMIKNNITSYTQLEENIRGNYNNMGIAAANMLKDVREDWTSSAQTMADSWNADNGDSVKSQVNAAYTSMETANGNYSRALDELAITAGIDFGPEGIKGAIDATTDATNQAKNATDQYAQAAATELPSMKAQVDALKTAWDGVKGAIEAAILALQEYINRLISAQTATPSTPVGPTGGGSSGGGGGTGTGGNSGGGSGSTSKTKTKASAAGYGSYTNPNGVSKTLAITKNGQLIAIIGRNSESKEDSKKALDNWAKQHGFDEWNTGGYTGTWNNGDTDGRIGLLHQKELVLNADDTKNFLSGISMIRDMASVNGSINDAIVRSMANMMFSLGNVKAANVNGSSIVNSSSTGENVFNITAEFPNANDVNEIREAILSLPNIASQYVNNNKR